MNRSSFYGVHCTHTKSRADAVVHEGREIVPSVYGQRDGCNTVYIATLEDMRKVGGEICFNEDQTEIWLRLPEGYKFSIRMLEAKE